MNLIQRSRSWYTKLLHFYPKPYYNRFAREIEQTFDDLVRERMSSPMETIGFLLWLFIETSIEIIKKNITFTITHMQNNKIFIWIALGTLGLLLIPFSMMYFNVAVPDPGSATQDGINWTLSDFIIMGTLIFTTSSLFVLSARKVEKNYRFGLAIAFIILFLYLWAELAVGIFTNWGS